MKEYKEIVEVVIMTTTALGLIIAMIGLSRLIYLDFKKQQP